MVGKYYHYDLTTAMKKHEIHVIHVFEDDWKTKNDIMKSIIRNFINPNSCRKLYARQCQIREVSLSDTNVFLSENHMIGKVVNFQKSIGLYFKDELVSIMVFRLISKKENKYELTRYAIKKGTKIIGGAKKIFTHYLQTTPCNIIVTYNDNATFSGDIYPILGFRYVRTNAPNYMFYSKDSDCRFPKQSIRKLKVGFKLETEKALGIMRIYNAGNDVYVY